MLGHNFSLAILLRIIFISVSLARNPFAYTNDVTLADSYNELKSPGLRKGMEGANPRKYRYMTITMLPNVTIQLAAHTFQLLVTFVVK